MPRAYVAASVKDGALRAFRQAGRPFVAWCRRSQEVPSFHEDWDEALVPWKEADQPSLSGFQQAIAAVELPEA